MATTIFLFTIKLSSILRMKNVLRKEKSKSLFLEGLHPGGFLWTRK
ncbi:MAG: hypothetical protein OH333_04675 [Candidatus Parvarchaeota archaeon]|nr:hypothetical protein [Candidatus Jingweiarchaeum tengchongense]